MNYLHLNLHEPNADHQGLAWNSFEHVWKALTPKNHDIPRQTLNLDWLARGITSFKANHSGSLKTLTLTPKKKSANK